MTKTMISRLLKIVNNRITVLKMSNKLSTAFNINSHLTHLERIKLYHLAESKNSILEIGSYVGASACCFGAAMQGNSEGKIFCIDTWNNEGMVEGIRDTYAEFSKNTTSFSKSIVPVRGFSTEVVDEITNQSQHLDLIFIDGDHSYDGVKGDWEAYKRFLIPGSIVVFHDWSWAEGVSRVIEEDVKPLVSDFDSLPNMWWGVI